MGNRSYEQDAKERYRKTFAIGSTSGDYASERITFGAVSAGTQDQSFVEVTVLAEAPFVSGAAVELWLPQVMDSSLSSPSARADGNYFNSGITPLQAAGSQRWVFSAWPGAQLRVKSGGVSGSLTLSASAY